MGRKRKGSELDVYVGTTKVGSYERKPDGSTAFRYDREWLASDRSFPISLSMPLSDRRWSGAQANAFFEGLLPDDPVIRDRIAARHNADSAGAFDLLAAIGRDCIGALRFVPAGQDPGDPGRMNARPIDDAEIAARLRELGTSPLGMDLDDDFRISLAGLQEKTAFLKLEDRWHVPLGPTPTSHIFKPALKGGPAGADFSDSPWNEWLCLAFCRALGLPAANADVVIFDERPVLVVERFDRRWDDRILYRLPQEDLCQALGVPPHRKYQNDGGPGIVEIMGLLNGAQDPYADRACFIKAQIVFWLLGAIDGHAKNFSIFLAPGGFRLTPLYDVMSAAPYPALSPRKAKMAMAVGDNRQYHLWEIQPRHFYQTGQKAGMAKHAIEDLWADVSSSIEAVIAEVDALAAAAQVPEHVRESVFDAVSIRSKLINDGA